MIQGAYFVSQALLSIPWVAAVCCLGTDRASPNDVAKGYPCRNRYIKSDGGVNYAKKHSLASEQVKRLMVYLIKTEDLQGDYTKI